MRGWLDGPRRRLRPSPTAAEAWLERRDRLDALDEHVARWESMVAASARHVAAALADPTLVPRPPGRIAQLVGRARARRLAALPPPPPRRTHTGRLECAPFEHDWIDEILMGDWGGLAHRTRCRRCGLTYYR